MNDDSDLNSVNSAGSSNGFRNSDEDIRSFRAYSRDEDDVTGQSGDENDEDQDASSQEGDHVSHDDDEDEDRGYSIKNESDDEDDNESMDEDTLMKNSKGKSLETTYTDSDNDESDNNDGRDDDDNDESMYDSPSKDIGQEDEDMDAEDAEQNQDDILEDNQSITNDSVAESSAVIATPVFEDSTDQTPGTTSSDAVAVAVAVESATEPSSQAEVVVAEVVPKKVKRKTPSSNKKKAVSPKKSKTPKQKGTGGRRKRSDSDFSTDSNAIPRDRLEAAQNARDILTKTINQTPFAISESHVIQNFGRIKVEDSEHPLFSNPTSLYPVGFACDRYEFSPVHGRILKMRCEILDGFKFKKGLNMGPDNEESTTKVTEHDGPLFRIIWGQGIDELEDGSPFPFEVYSSCTPMMKEVDAVAVPLGFHSNSTKPENGMRVKVRIDKNSWYRGTVMSVKHAEDEIDDDDSSKQKSPKKKKPSYHVTIVYDDGLTEETIYPDPDISLVSPGK
jgi:hypothetical protein